MVPVFPDKVKVVPVPEHIVELAAETEPATEVGLTVIVCVFVLAAVHAPLVTTAL